MKWSLDELVDYQDVPMSVETTLDLKDDLTSRYADEILDAQPVKVHAYILYDHGNAIVSAHVTGEITVPSSRSLTPVVLPLDFSFNEVYVPTQAALARLEEKDDADVVLLVDDDGKINLNKAVGDNIITQIPMHILSEDERKHNIMPSGDDWKVISEDDYFNPQTDSKHVDPRLAKLGDLFKDDSKS